MSAGDPEPARLHVAGVRALSGLLGLVQAAYRDPDVTGGWTTEADLIGGTRTDAGLVLALVTGTRDTVLLLGEPSAPVACCAVGFRDGRASLGLFAVRPGEQGRGVGTAVLRGAERYVRTRWAADALHLAVVSGREELIAWYERRGYARTGETEPFPYGDARYGTPRRDDLELVVLRRPLA